MLKRVKKTLKKLYYFGVKHHCTACGCRLRLFNETGVDSEVLKRLRIIGSGKRLASCPICYSIDRDRLLMQSKFLRKIENKNVLHVAPESKLVKMLRFKNSYHAIDFFTEGYNYPEFVKHGDVTSLEFKDHLFDVVICNHVLEHIVDDKKAMTEIHRVLKQGGYAILQVPLTTMVSNNIEEPNHKPNEREKLFGQYDHVRIYAKDEYVSRLEEVGFSVIIERPECDRKKLGINPDEFVVVAIKN